MILLVSGATRHVVETTDTRIGRLYVPLDRCRAQSDRPWAADNGAYLGFQPEPFLTMLQRLRGVPRCVFVAAPDVVGNAGHTLAAFEQWEPVLHAYGFPVALVAQDGLRPSMVPWSRIEAVFIGGTTAWKESRDVDNLLGVAAALGKWRHVGRVNTLARVRHFWRRCDSIDGSGFSRFPQHISGRFLRWIDALEQQPRLSL